jgi:hypothetical protein
MNFVLDNYHVDEKNISFLETKKNNIIDGNFTKIIYKDTFVTVNGIYLLFPVTVTGVDKSNGKTNVFFNPKIASNTSIINHISDIEGKIINCYKQEYNVSYKRNMSTLFNLLYNGKVKLYKEINYNPSHINIVTNHGFTRETNVYVGQRSYASQLTHPVAKLPSELVIESAVSYWSGLHKERWSPTTKFSLHSLCNGSSATGEFCSEKLVVGGYDEGKPSEPPTFGVAVQGCKLRLLTPDQTTPGVSRPKSLVVEPLRGSDQNPTKIVLKISGIWETANEIGITYKFLDMH